MKQAAASTRMAGSVWTRGAIAWKARRRTYAWSYRRALLPLALLLLAFALIAPGIPVKTYRRYPTISGVFLPPVDPDYVERRCIVHVVSEIVEGDYYLECPSMDHPLFHWSPILALGGILTISRARSVQIGRWMRWLLTTVEGLAGLEGMAIAFATLLGPIMYEAIPGVLGYPIGFFAVLHSMRRSGAGSLALMSVASLILLVSGVMFFLMLIASIGMSEY